MNEQQTERLLTLLGQIADSLAILAGERNPDEAPDIELPLDDFNHPGWAQAIGAIVVAADEFGPSVVQHGGKIYKRRTKEDFGTDIWFSRCTGTDDTGHKTYATLITFKPADKMKVKAVGREVEQELKRGKKATPAAPAATPPASPPATAQPDGNPRHEYKAIPHPWPGPIVIDWLQDTAAWAQKNGKISGNGTLGTALALMQKVKGEAGSQALIRSAAGADNAALLTGPWAYALVNWVKAVRDPETGDYIPAGYFREEMEAALVEAKAREIGL